MNSEQLQTPALKVSVVGIGWAGQQHLKAYSSIHGVETLAVAGMEEEPPG
ncbi:hypothetical protein [Arthrobacter sp. NQ4]|nr:hypothetical protein [Arthrobacter sp. NQ4]MDE8586174.1 hypothetical protein [Arthrobacter sp. NQ4]